MTRGAPWWRKLSLFVGKLKSLNLSRINKFEIVTFSATRRLGCNASLGGFGGLFDLQQAGLSGTQDTVLVSGADGVGTKLIVAQAVGKHDTVGIDLVAMNVNDIVVCGAQPLFFLDYFATGQLDVDVAAQVSNAFIH